MTHNGGVDAAARFHSSIAGPIMLRNTLPPLASNDLLCGAAAVIFDSIILAPVLRASWRQKVCCFLIRSDPSSTLASEDHLSIPRRDHTENKRPKVFRLFPRHEHTQKPD